jgi:hypothetical protein
MTILPIGETIDPWFPDPTTRDDSWAKRGESPFSWVSRSTVLRAASSRNFLNHNLALLPSASQSTIYAALSTRWQSAFFELVVARCLQQLGASLIVEPEGTAGARIDFEAIFDDATVMVEAISPIADGEVGDTLKQRNPLLDIIESALPPGWGVGISELPELGLNDSKSEFRQTVIRMFGSVPSHVDQLDLVEEFPRGRLRLSLWRFPPGNAKVVFEPPMAAWNDAEDLIRRAVQRKKRQARSAPHVALVAIHAAGLLSTFEDFDVALLGHSVMVIDQHRNVTGTRFDADGLLSSQRSEPPVFAGVLAFTAVGFRPFAHPVLYINSRFKGSLPKSLLSLEQRCLSADRTYISVRPSQRPNLLAGLGLIPDHT